MTTKPHEFVPGVIFHNRCKECGVPFEYHSFPSEPEKPVDERCTCWSPDGGHDGDCAIWGDRSWPPKTMETKEGLAFAVNKSHVEPDGTRVIDDITVLGVGVGASQIWQCEGCKRTFPEYVNGCPFADNDPTHPMQRSVVAAHETWIEAVEPEQAENEALRPPELSIGEWRAWVYRQEHGWPCEACGLYTCSCPQLGYN